METFLNLFFLIFRDVVTKGFMHDYFTQEWELLRDYVTYGQ